MDVGTLSVNLELKGQSFTVSVKDAERTLRSLQRSLDETKGSVSKLENHMGSITTKFRHFVMTLGMVRFALMDLNDVFLKLPTHIMKTAGELERLQKLMEGLATATTDAGRIQEALGGTNYIIGLAQNAPFTIKALSDSFVKLKTAGVDPTNGSLKGLVDSIAKFGGNSESLHRASIAIQQMAGKGVISMEELRQQLGEAMPNAFQLLAEGAGMSMSKLIQHVSRGEVQSAGALNRLFAMMIVVNNGAAQKMMDTWTGMLQQLETRWMMFEKTIADSGFMASMKIVVKDLLAFFDDPKAVAFAKDVGRSMGQLVLVVRDVIKGVVEMWEYIKLAGEAMLVYFGGTRILHALNSMRAGILGVVEATVLKERVERAAITAKLAADREAALIDARQMQRASEVAVQELLVNKEKYAALTAEHAKYMHSLTVAESFYRLNAAGKLIDDRGRFVSAATAASNAATIASLERMAVVSGSAAVNQKKLVDTLESGVIVSRAAAQEKLNLASQMGNVAAKATGLGAALGVMGRGLMALVGGPIGLLTTALFAGAVAWELWGDKAAKAMKKIDDEMRNGIANKATLQTIQDQLYQKQLDLASAEAKVRRDGSGNPRTGGGFDRVNAVALREVASINKDIENLQRKLNDALKQVVRNDADEITRVWQKGIDDRIQASDAAVTAKVNLERNATKKALENDSLSAVQKEKMQEESNKRVAELVKKGWAQRLAIADGEIARITTLLEGSGLGQAQQRALKQQLTKAREDANAMHDMFAKGGSKLGTLDLGPGKQPKDPLTTALEHSRGALKASQILLNDLDDGVINFSTHYDAVLQKIFARAKAGDFDKPIPGSKTGEMNRLLSDGKVKASRLAEFTELVDNTVQTDLNNRARMVASNLVKLGAAANIELVDSMARLNNEGEKETTGLKRLEKQLERMKTNLSDDRMQKFLGGKTFDQVASLVKMKQAATDLSNFTGDLELKNKDIRSSLILNDRDRMESQFQEEKAHQERMFKLRVDALRMQGQGSRESEAIILANTSRFVEHQELLVKQHALKMRTPLEQLADQWRDVAKQMQETTAKWANDILDAIMNMVKTGKFEWKTLVESMLTDLLRMQLKKNLADPLKDILNKGGDWLKDMLFGKAQMPAAVKDSDSIGAMITPGKLAMEQLAASQIKLTAITEAQDIALTGATSATQAMTAAAEAAAAALNNVAIAGGEAPGFRFGGGLGGSAGGGSGGAMDYTDLLGNVMPEFASGGIMSRFGNIPLRKYTAGGVARTAQLALFGEGSENEAFVPLPDGRRIPVAMQGGGGANVTLNVINQTGTPVDAQKSAPRFDGKQMILDVVLTAVNTPGPFRDGMKNGISR